MRIPLSAPDIDDDDLAAVAAVLRSGRLSLGPSLDAFERAFADYVGVPFAVAVSSGTAGLHLSLLALGIGPGDEVIVPSFTFIAAANAIRYVGATPVFVDILPDFLNIDPACVRSAITPRTRALMVIHNFGVPADLDALLAIAAEHRLSVLEDACEAIGATHRGRRIGGFGDAGVFAFYPNKQITTGEGGMVVTHREEIAAAARALRNQGRRPGDWFEHIELGYNYRLSEMNCALGVSQLRRINSILARRAAVAHSYGTQLGDDDKLALPSSGLENDTVSWFVYVIRLRHASASQRDAIVAAMTERGIQCGRYFAPLHLQPAYASVPAAQVRLSVTETESARTIALPFFNQLSAAQIAEVSDALKEICSAVW